MLVLGSKRGWRIGRGLGHALAIAGLLQTSSTSALPTAPEAGDCSLDNATPVTVVAVDDDFSLLLDDGRRAALTGLDFPGPEFATLRIAARKRLSEWTGRDVFFGPANGDIADRWGRVSGRVFGTSGVDQNAPLVSVGGALLSEGLARFRPDPSAATCARDYLRAEAEARSAERGVWAQSELKVVPAENHSVLLQRKGMVLVEGEIYSIGQTERAIYLNFKNKRRDAFAAVILRRNLAMFAGAGIDPLTLVGRQARVRGLIETGFGPRIEILSPAAIELIGDPAP